MIGEVKGLATCARLPRLPRGDVRALAQAVAALSRLALIAGRPVAEGEINPLIVKREGVVAVDGLVVLKEQDFSLLIEEGCRRRRRGGTGSGNREPPRVLRTPPLLIPRRGKPQEGSHRARRDEEQGLSPPR